MMRPVGHQVMVEVTNDNTRARFSQDTGLYLPPTKIDEESLFEGKVVALGEYAKRPFDVDIGDEILFKCTDTIEVVKDNKRMRIVRHDNIIAMKV